MLDMEQFLILKSNMENRIMDMVSSELQGFQENTGASPFDINIGLTEITAVGDRSQIFMVAKVETRFSLCGGKVKVG